MEAAGTTQTKVIVRVKSKDAKFVGTSMGGAAVVIRDSETGKVLAHGITSGGTGNTQKIVTDPVQRGALLSDESAAKFDAVIDIPEPRLVTVEVEAPMVRMPNTIKSSTQLWLIPGKDILGDGLIIEVSGFAVMAAAPKEIRLSNGGAVIPVEANIVMI